MKQVLKWVNLQSRGQFLGEVSVRYLFNLKYTVLAVGLLGFAAGEFFAQAPPVGQPIPTQPRGPNQPVPTQPVPIAPGGANQPSPEKPGAEIPAPAQAQNPNGSPGANMQKGKATNGKKNKGTTGKSTVNPL